MLCYIMGVVATENSYLFLLCWKVIGANYLLSNTLKCGSFRRKGWELVVRWDLNKRGIYRFSILQNIESLRSQVLVIT